MSRFGVGTFVGDEYNSYLVLDTKTGLFDLLSNYDHARYLVAYVNNSRDDPEDKERIIAEITRYWEQNIEDYGEDTEWRYAYDEAVAVAKE